MTIEHGGQIVGERIGNYRLIHLLGSGGFADVYLGEHLHLGSYAAIKVLHTKLINEQLEQFRQEARILARLIHPHIVRVLDFDVQNMIPFLVMSFAPGGTLRQLHPKGSRVPLGKVVEYVEQVASALDYAHSQKLIHRDVKPGNMLIDQQGRIVLSDFGVASIVHNTQSQTLVAIAGSIAYIAPEQIQGRPSTASDQYALAGVVYEWLSGESLFQGSMSEMVSQHLMTPPPPLSERIPGITPAVEKVIFTALAKDPRERYASIQDFATALAQASMESTTNIFDEEIALLPVVVEQRSTYAQESDTSTSSIHSTQQKPHRQLLSVVVSVLLVVLLVIGGIVVTLGRSTYTITQDHHNTTATAQAQAASNVTTTPTPTPASRAAAIASATPIQLYSIVTSISPTWSDPLSSQDTNNWTVSANCAFSGGMYHITSNTAKTVKACYASNTNFCNMAFQVQIIDFSGEGGGIDFRSSSSHTTSHHTTYVFEAKPEGAYDFYDVVASGVEVIPYTRISSPAFHTGYNVSNVITVIARGSNFYFYLNQQFLTSASDSSLTCGEIGLQVLDWTSPASASFSNAKVWKF